MKKIILFTVGLLGLITAVQAQMPNNAVEQPFFQKKLAGWEIENAIYMMRTNSPDLFAEYQIQRRKYDAMKIGGILATSVGGVAILSGAAMFFDLLFHIITLNLSDEHFRTLVRGTLFCLLGGAALVGGGVPLIVIGGKKGNRLKREAAQQYLNNIGYNYNDIQQINVSIGTTANGIGLIVKF